MCAISGIIFYHSFSEDPKSKVLGLPERWFWAIGYSAFCVLVECLLNMGGHLVWEYSFWERSLAGIWLIFLFGYLHFYVAAILVIGLSTLRKKVMAVGAIYAVVIVANLVAMGLLGWVY